MKKFLPLFSFIFLFACSSPEDVPEASHIEASDTYNYKREIISHHDELRECFVRFAPTIEIVNLTTILIIAPNGSITKRQFKANQKLTSKIIECLSEAVDEMDFRAPARGGTIELTHVSKFKVAAD